MDAEPDKVARIKLTRGKFAIVDADLYESLVGLGWYCATNGYAVRPIKGTANPKKCEYLHRVVNCTPEGMQTDHINGDKLDNRRCNLRSVTNGDNMRNTTKRRDNTSGYKGVGYFPQTKRWRATIRFQGKAKHIGFYATKELAMAAHTAFVKEHFAEISNRHLAEISQ